jgi:hypothetical protein
MLTIGTVVLKSRPAPEDATPRRIRRQRTRGWKLAAATTNPNGAAVVDRTSRWGNPFAVRLAGNTWTVDDTRTGENVVAGVARSDAQARAIDCFRAYLAEYPDLVALARERLAGRDLACFCAPGDPCHADVWLEVANSLTKR